MYNKLFTKILDSSIWLAPDPFRLVWITLIASMDEDSIAHYACTENLAARARVSVEDTEKALAAFQEPDPYDPTQEFDGRRIERVPGGWFLLNGAKYRRAVTRSVMLEQNRERVRRYRERHKAPESGNVTVMHHKQDHKQEHHHPKKLKATRKSPSEIPEWFVEFKSVFPRRAGDPDWAGGLRSGNARIAEGHSPAEFLAGARRYAAYIEATGKGGTEFVKQASGFLGPGKPFSLPWNAPAKPVSAIDAAFAKSNKRMEELRDAQPSGGTAMALVAGSVREHPE